MKIKTIVAIGGGEIGRPGTQKEIVSIDKHLISLSGKKHPNLLFIPTASGDSQNYIDVVGKYFGKFLDCKVDHLCLTHNPSNRLIEDKFSNADIIYVGGGNTKKMLSMWRKYNLHAILKEAWEKGTILSGVSAGAVCWFSYAHSDSLKEKTGEYCRVKGLGFIRGLACPHLIRESDRLPSFKKMHNKYGGMGFAIDDYAAIVFRGNEVYSVASRPNSHTHLYSNNKKTTLQNVR